MNFKYLNIFSQLNTLTYKILQEHPCLLNWPVAIPGAKVPIMLNIIFIANETYFNDIEARDIFYLKTILNGSYCYCVKKNKIKTPKPPETLKIELNNNWGVSFFDVH